MKSYIELYEKGNENIENDFDMIKYIKHMRDLSEIKEWYDKYTGI